MGDLDFFSLPSSGAFVGDFVFFSLLSSGALVGDLVIFTLPSSGTPVLFVPGDCLVSLVGP